MNIEKIEKKTTKYYRVELTLNKISKSIST